MAPEYIPPQFKCDGFNCPHCGAFAHQTWHCLALGFTVKMTSIQTYVQDSLASKCQKCGSLAFWVNETMVYPQSSNAPLPSEDMPEDVKKIYSEARDILNSSPRAATALLRIAVELLVSHLDTQGNDLNDKIGYLVKNGLDSKIQQALDSVRVIGNHAVHPGLIEIDDDNSIALKLFSLINIIVDLTITTNRKIKEMYDIIPEKQKKAIERRDN